MNWSTPGANWILALGEIRNGKGFFLQGKEPMLCPRNFALYVPPFSLIRGDARAAEAYLNGNVFHGPAPANLPGQALLFIPSHWSLPLKPEQVHAFIETGSSKIKIDVSQSPSYLAEKAKRHLDENFLKDLKIPELAFKLRTNPASLSREFQTQTGLSLTEYHELLRHSHATTANAPDGSRFQVTGLNFLHRPRFE